MRKVIFDFGDWDITLRELIASLVIVAVLLTIGVIVSEKITAAENDHNMVLEQSAQITDPELFKYCMKTNVGNAFVYGDLDAVNPVSCDEVKGTYSKIICIHEKYTKHTRTVTEHYTVNGKTQTRTKTETYWTWDEVGRDSKCVDNIIFCGEKFPYGKIGLPSAHHIDTIRTGYHKRDVYEGVDAHFTGTIFTELKDNTITDAQLYQLSIEDTIERMKKGSGVIIFWIIWIIFIILANVGFYYLDNSWLEG